MNLKTILCDGLEIQVTDQAAPVIQRTISALESKLRDAFKKLKEKEEADEEDEEENQKKDAALKAKDEAIKAKDKAMETKDGEIAGLKKVIEDLKTQASPAALDAKARERTNVIMKARALLGDKLRTDGMSVVEIRRAVVDARMPGGCQSWSDDRVEGAFMALESRTFGDRGDDRQ